MKIKIDTTGLHESKWYEYVVRFAFGGTVTALAGVIAKHYGPEIGGLFLAFPAILPATATLIEKHEIEKKHESGRHGTASGRKVAGVDAAGAAMGCVGLAVFALVVWKELPQSSLPLVLVEATVAWLIAAVAIWLMREKLWRALSRKVHRSHRVGPVERHPESSVDGSSARRREK
ncbi:MAG: DUF3147 family protein [Candidatus Sulfotelmatobacter sp.]